MSELEIGVALPTMEEITALGRDGIVAVARHAEAVGLDSVGAADVLIGDGTLALESMVVLSTAAAVTERIALSFGVLSVPTRPLAMLAAQVQTLQYLSGGRVRLGLGIGGFPGSPFWHALDAPERRRGNLLDLALDKLPGLIAGEPTSLPGSAETVSLRLAPAATVPPLYVGGGTSEVVLRRIATRADGWLPSFLTPAELSSAVTRLRELAAEAGRPAPRVELGMHGVLGDRPEDRADREQMLAKLGDFAGMSRDRIAAVTLTGGPEEAADRLAEFAEAGADEIGIGFDSRDHLRQLDLLGEARVQAAR
ncbi:LLM class flavin-dependent oxidoreductase [Nocardia sp. NPDC058176]|uniref:LLM class flavin-dependent oxidoreductase n=1 Tax=Nocardia sp. NPDC058176 TaxID=3346368 RepID=UPI0036DB7A50